jgi:EAL domain-containing protein (putative c-di-GMP-specific phosphodiesterase class I)
MTFIPAAERYHLISTIDRWVICTFFASYQEHYQRAVRQGQVQPQSIYTINLSGSSLNQDFLHFLKKQFVESKIPYQSICFEVTETAAIANLEQASQFIHSLKALGCQFALDDFGNGMSSFAYLKNLPVDYLKIDGSFVKDMDSDQIDFAMVECFNRLSHVMNIQTIAECVENQSILKKLQKIGVDHAQGYYIDRPKPLVFK